MFLKYASCFSSSTMLMYKSAFRLTRRSFFTMSKNYNLKDAKILSCTPMKAGENKWIKLDKIEYQAPDGKARQWEMASRTTRSAGQEVDGVGIIAIIKDKVNGPQIILQKQYRPPVEGVCIEMPAGLMDPNETVEECALRELREETGYIGTVVSSSPVIFNDPGFTNTNTRIVIVEVDMTDERNVHPVTELEDSEFIETFTVPLKQFHASLDKLYAEGYKLDARLQNIAHGVQLAQTMGL